MLIIIVSIKRPTLEDGLSLLARTVRIAKTAKAAKTARTTKAARAEKNKGFIYDRKRFELYYRPAPRS